ncbi:MAG: hypothetical protein OXG44_04670 [Gammaproteobacteria bacterium]|nr:hypothetical protein [Gammaproteobacteria bacterium]
MKRLRAGLLLALVAFAGCGEDAPITPAPLPPPIAPPPEPPPPSPAPDAIPVGFGGVLPAPGAALTLHPGAEFVVLVMVDGDLGEAVDNPAWTGIPVRVATDAPAAVLSVPAGLTVAARREPDLLRIRALESAEVAPEVYTVHLEAPPGGLPELPGLSFRLESEPVRLRLVDPGPAGPADCGRLALRPRAGVRRGDGGALGENWFGDLGSHFRSADLVLRSPGTDVELRLLDAYQQLPYGGSGEAYNLVPVMFAHGLELEETDGEFEQTLSLAWFDELTLRATVPGCTPLTLRCDDRGRCRTR